MSKHFGDGEPPFGVRRRGFLASLFGGAVATVVGTAAARSEQKPEPTPEPTPEPDPAVPPMIAARVRPGDGTALHWLESRESHEDLPRTAHEGDACFVTSGPYADTAFVAVADSGGWVPFGCAVPG